MWACIPAVYHTHASCIINRKLMLNMYPSWSIYRPTLAISVLRITENRTYNMHAYTHMHADTHTRTDAHTHAYACMCVNMQTLAVNISQTLHIMSWAHFLCSANIWPCQIGPAVEDLYIHWHIHAHTHTCTRIRTCTHTHTHKCTHTQWCYIISYHIISWYDDMITTPENGTLYTKRIIVYMLIKL